MEHDSDQHMFDLALKLLDDVDVRVRRCAGTWCSRAAGPA
jgi:hypothetical protein